MDHEKLRIARNKSNVFAAHLGITVERLSEGRAEAAMEVRPEHMNPLGIVHGGCMYTMADVACSFAVASYGYNAVTSCSVYHYLAAAKNVKCLRAAAKVIKYGKNLAVTEVEVFSDGGGVLGKGTFTHYILGTDIVI